VVASATEADEGAPDEVGLGGASIALRAAEADVAAKDAGGAGVVLEARAPAEARARPRERWVVCPATVVHHLATSRAGR
jgi:hypothetical protein